MWGGVPLCERVCPSVGVGVPVWEDVPQCGKVFPSVGVGVPVREGVPSVGECAQMWKGVLSA